MTNDEIIRRLKAEAGRRAPRGARQAVSKATGLSYGYLSRLVYDEIENPGGRQLDMLRKRYERRA